MKNAREKAIEMYSKGMGCKEVADLLGIQMSTAYTYKTDYNSLQKRKEKKEINNNSNETEKNTAPLEFFGFDEDYEQQQAMHKSISEKISSEVNTTSTLEVNITNINKNNIKDVVNVLANSLEDKTYTILLSIK